MSELLLRVRGLRVEFHERAAVRDVDLDLHAGETLGLLGESGSGKSTLARAILRLAPVRAGSVHWRGEDLLNAPAERLRTLRKDLQIVFQSPHASLNPRMTIADAIAEPLLNFEPRLGRDAMNARVGAMLERVGLIAEMGSRYPHEFSGGQCQRVGIARAMILNPRLLICDEPASALDVSIQGQIVNLLADLQSEFGTAMLLISHNLGVVRHLSRRVAVIYQGRFVESAVCDDLFSRPLHPYSAALLRAAAGAPPGQRQLPPSVHGLPPSVHGLSPSVHGLPPSVRGTDGAGGTGIARRRDCSAGCAYRDRCAHAIAVCDALEPPLLEFEAGHLAACHRSGQLGPVS